MVAVKAQNPKALRIKVTDLQGENQKLKVKIESLNKEIEALRSEVNSLMQDKLEYEEKLKLAANLSDKVVESKKPSVRKQKNTAKKKED